MPENTPNPDPTTEPADAIPEPAAPAPEAPAAAAGAETGVPAGAPAAAIVPDTQAVPSPDHVDAAADPEPAADPAPPDAAAAAPRAPAIPDLSPAACAAALAGHFPALFGAGRALPIKLRIQADIQQRVPGVFSKKSLSIFLHRHTTSTAYIKALVNAAHRFDLDGQPAGEIAQEHKDAAVAELERRLAIVQARRVAEREALRQARRPPAAAAAAPADGAPAAEGQPVPPQAPRPPRTERPPRGDRPPRPDAAPRGDRPPRPDRADRPPRAERPPRADRPAATMAPPQATVRDATAPAAHAVAEVPAAPSVPLTPEQIAANEARRARAALLRAFETTTLTRSNFCALKGLKDEVLEAQLVQAREERKLHPPPAAERDRERPREDRPRFEDRGPRRDAPSRPGGPRGGRPPR